MQRLLTCCLNIEGVVYRCYSKYVFLKFSANLIKKTPVLESLFNKVADLQAPRQEFFYEIYETFKNALALQNTSGGCFHKHFAVVQNHS